MASFITNSPKETEEIAEKLAHTLKGGEVIAFEGPMGMGKTCFTRGLAKGLGFNGQVNSPTFALVNEYKGERLAVFHFDMYRIEDEDDLYSIGFYDYLERNGICLVEWSEKIPYALPEDYLRVTIEKDDADTPDSRRITVERCSEEDMG